MTTTTKTGRAPVKTKKTKPSTRGADAITVDLLTVSAERNQLQASMIDADVRIATFVREAFRAGMTVGPIVDATGLSKARIYQLRDGRR
jgi:hypothetical protein